jgi:hypothetical protein
MYFFLDSSIHIRILKHELRGRYAVLSSRYVNISYQIKRLHLLYYFPQNNDYKSQLIDSESMYPGTPEYDSNFIL